MDNNLEIQGLTQSQVEKRVQAGKTNVMVDSVSKTTREIIIENTFTYFNMIFFVLTILVCLAGSFRSLTFLPVVIGNTLIGIFQEVRAKNVLEKMNILDAALDSRYLLEYVTGQNNGWLFLHGSESAEQKEIAAYTDLIKKRARRIPLQHLTGVQEFMGLSFYVNEHVLVPRQDTECLVEMVLPITENKKILDMCTGSGCIAISLAVLGKAKECTAVDLSDAALEVAKKNARINRADVKYVQSDLFEKIDDTYDIIVSNPPYIPQDVIEGLMEEVREHEPRMALDGGKDGLDFYRSIIVEGVKHLNVGGWLFFEIGCEQAKDVMDLMRMSGYYEVNCQKDYAGNDRVVYGHR